MSSILRARGARGGEALTEVASSPGVVRTADAASVAVGADAIRKLIALSLLGPHKSEPTGRTRTAAKAAAIGC